MIERRLLRQLEKVAGRVRQTRLMITWTSTWLIMAAIAALLLAVNRLVGFYWSPAVPVLALLAAVVAVLSAIVSYRSVRDYHRLAQRVEIAFPDLESSLLAAVDQQPRHSGGQFGFLQLSVIEQTLRHAYANTWYRAIPTWKILASYAANLLAFAAFVATLACLAVYASPARRGTPVDGGLAADTIGTDSSVTIEPGSTEVERGTSLLVLARFQGPLPPEATLFFAGDGGESSQVAMSKSLDDPIFGGRIAGIEAPLSYRVEYADRQSDEYRVTVFDYPRLVQADAQLVFPDYTSLEDRLVQDIRHVSAVEGTQLTLLCHLNKPVAEAKLVGQDGSEIKMVEHPSQQHTYQAEIEMIESQRLTLRLVDEQGRENKLPPEFVINVLPNKPPDLKLVLPARDTQVSPLEELDLKANAWDDYGVDRVGVSFALAGEAADEVVLAQAITGKQRFEVKHTVAFEQLDAEPDELLSYHFWAEDTGPDGDARRTSGDMYFAEVRHFEEIFRQGQQPPGQSQQQQQQMQGNAREAQQLAELQKQIINATWKLIRRETGDTPSAKFREDVALLVESQTTALQQVDELAERIQDPQSATYIDDVRRHMLDAASELVDAKNGPDIAALPPALTSEQAAYQALLKLRAREHEVVRSSQRSAASQAGGQSQRAQQQLQQLQLTNEENRYETERTAQTQQEQQDGETRQILNRLRELARRQGDLNERLKELQSALEEARTQEQREEIRRQLKRLWEEQQQILRDTEELESRMQQPQNQEQMSEQRQQVDQTRDNLRQASEALEEGRVSQALTSGTRAEREFEELREEFRRRASGRFNEEMREMRQQARELDERQQNLGQRLDDLTSPQTPSQSLRDTGDRERIEEELGEQRERVSDLLEQMQETVLDAETAEPLLAEQLYDTIRETQQDDLDRALRSTTWSLERGLLDDAQQQEQAAGEGISQLREGVERAAESILGDETEALRRAQQQLDELSRQLNEEIARSDPNGQQQQQQQGGGQQQGQQQQSQQQTEQQPGRQQRQGQQQGEQQQDQEGQQQQGQQQQGQQQQGQQQGQQQEQRQQEQQGQQQQEGQQQQGQQQQGQQQQGQQQQGQGQGQQQQGQTQQQGQDRRGGPRNQSTPSGMGGFERLLNQGVTNRSHEYAPITGTDYVEWSDGMRDVEEMIDDPELRSEAARIRDRARGFRGELKRHSRPPNWDLVRLQVAEPLAELRDRVAEELLKRTSKDAVVPIDRDPVPPKFAEPVRRYFERLGTGQ